MQASAVDLALILAVDVSSSIDAGDYRLQMDGIAGALRDHEIQQAIAAGPFGAIALSLVQWSTKASQATTLDWSVIGSAAQAEGAAAAVEKITRHWVPGGTGMAAAIRFCAQHFHSLSWQATHHVIDISGDGEDSEGGDVAGARANAVAADITINGLPIISGSTTIEDYYARRVIAGSNCFYVPATNIMAFHEAIRKKLLREIELIAA
jgi:hypothetical protein